MVADRSPLVALADDVSALLRGVAGWLLVGLGLSGVAVVAARAAGGTIWTVWPALVVLALSVVAVVAGLAVNPRSERRYARSRFGRVRSVDRRVVRVEEDPDESCVACGGAVDRGLCRRYREEFVVAGVPLTSTDGDENYYCLDCAATELGLDVADDGDRSADTNDGADFAAEDSDGEIAADDADEDRLLDRE